ncbi:hypothetical protein [Bacillus sp. FJAT-27445]|nr:hypothetical protein [Bacillus sp. FJAT-27445]
MKEKDPMLSRRELDEAFHSLQDQITRITVEEEEEMVKQEIETEEAGE